MNKIKKGDKVKIMLGKDRGKTGTINRVIPKKEQVVINGLNVYKRNVRKQGDVEGGIIELSKPLNISNVSLICPNCNKPTRVGFMVGANKKKTRICRKCKKEI